jgi:hypothetical protein
MWKKRRASRVIAGVADRQADVPRSVMPPAGRTASIRPHTTSWHPPDRAADSWCIRLEKSILIAVEGPSGFAVTPGRSGMFDLFQAHSPERLHHHRAR